MAVHCGQVLFPRELTDAVLDNLLGDYPTLNSCALVCRDWKNPSQRILFRSVKFEQVKMETFRRNMTALINVLQENPQLAKFVREICLQWCKVSVINFLNHMPHLPMVEHLVLKNISFISWSEEGVKAPQKILALPNLKKLDLFDTTFEDMDQLLKVFVTCGVNVDTLRLHRLSIIKAKPIWFSYRLNDLDDEGSPEEAHEKHSSPRSEQPPDVVPKTKLRTLDIIRGSPSMIALWMSKKNSPFDLSKLESLRYEEDVLNPQFGALNGLLTICGESLEHLEIYCPRDPVKKNNAAISTARLPNLKSLIISGIGPYSLANAILFLSQLSSDSRINKLVLEFTFGNMPIHANKKPEKEWSDLDAAVDNIPLLHLINLEVRLPRRLQRSDAEIIKTCQSRLPRVTEKSICNLTIL